MARQIGMNEYRATELALMATHGMKVAVLSGTREIANHNYEVLAVEVAKLGFAMQVDPEHRRVDLPHHDGFLVCITPEDCDRHAPGFTSCYDGVDLSGLVFDEW